jgi:hypothetical protein
MRFLFIFSVFQFLFAGAWGLLVYCEYSWQAINLASVFLLLGVGLDDTFVMLSAWRHTDENAGTGRI